MNIDKQNEIIQKFIKGSYTQIHCKECEMTFLTNVFEFDDTHVLLEKRSLGLEYYCGAIYSKQLTKVPNIQRVGILDEEDNPVKVPSQEEVFSGDETDLRLFYVMEKLKHLSEDDSTYFDNCVKNLEWRSDKDRSIIIAGVTKRYNAELALNISKLYDYYKEHETILAWDLHGENLMMKPESNEIVILDPFTRKA